MISYIKVILIYFNLTFGAVRLQTAQQALDYVYAIREGTCGAGVGEVLPLQFDVTAWNQYTDPAIRTANFLSKVIQMNNGTLDSLTDEMFFLLVRNNVHSNSIVFGSGTPLEKGVYSKYELFCPYAYKKNGTVWSHDLSVNYSYLEPNTDYYENVKIKDWSHVEIVRDRIQYRQDDHHLPEVEESYPIAKLSDGHWTDPYFDCGGGNVWMVTYSSPIFRVENGSVLFRGVATIDIELTYIDINQCEKTEEENVQRLTGLDVFRGTHKCQQTTSCIPMKGQGFVTGAYRCECNKGYYFPLTDDDHRVYTGTELEDHFRQFGYIKTGLFRCSECASGCDTCIDSSPWLHDPNNALQISLLILASITVLGIMCIAVATYINRNKMAIKSASPPFLALMCLGGILMCSQFFTTYFQATVLVCKIRIWPEHVGFYILYGSLVLKTWRISIIFTIGTRRKVHVPDMLLYQRLGILIALSVAMLGAWTTSQTPEVQSLRTSEHLLFYICCYGPWEYAVIAAETLLLLYGVYLCFTLRKVKAQFYDKYMSYAIYNAMILGIFISLASRLFIQVIGHDLKLVLEFVEMQVNATMTLLIVFIPKFWAVRKGADIVAQNTIRSISHTTVRCSNGRFQTIGMGINEDFLNSIANVTDKATQTKWKSTEEGNN